MAKYTIVKLKNLTPLHIGTGKENYDFSAEELQSDTISAALSAIRAQNGKTDGIEEFMNSFTISSAFPYFGSIYFLPKFLGKIDVEVENSEKEQNRKVLKNIRYVELSLWQQLAKGVKLKIRNNQIQGKYLISEIAKFNKPAQSEVMQRVTIPRQDGQNADPFYFDWTYFNRQSGLYFLISCPDNILSEIKELFENLGEAGIGTDRNVGGGKFETEFAEINIEDVPNTNACALLSLFIPTKDELQSIELTSSRYQLLQRGGFIAGSTEEDFRHLRKKSVYMFSVGSVFSGNHILKGKVVNLTPDWNDERMHPVYRNGKPFYLPVKI